MAVREAWTDERLDDLSGNMGREFDRVHADLREMREEMRAESRAVRDEMSSGAESLRAEMAAMQRTIVVTQRTTIVGFAAVIASVLVTRL